jgi:hypothetical protein
MATLWNCKDGDSREDWVRIAIQFARRGILVYERITVHGPHDSTCNMWGGIECGEEHGTGRYGEFKFSAKSNGSKYRPFKFRIWEKDSKELYPVLKASELDPKTARWMKAARRTLGKLEAARRTGSAEVARLRAEIFGGKEAQCSQGNPQVSPRPGATS